MADTKSPRLPITGHNLQEAIWNSEEQTKIRNKFLVRPEVQKRHENFLERAQRLKVEEMEKARRNTLEHRVVMLDQSARKAEQREKVQSEIGQKLPEPPTVPALNPYTMKRSSVELLTGPKVLAKFGSTRMLQHGISPDPQQLAENIRAEQIQAELGADPRDQASGLVFEQPSMISMEDSKRFVRRMSQFALVSQKKVMEKDAELRAMGTMVKDQGYFFKNSSGELINKPYWEDVHQTPKARQKLFRDPPRERLAVEMIKEKMLAEDDDSTYRELLRDAHRDYVLRQLHTRKLHRIELEKNIGTPYTTQCSLKSLPTEHRLTGALEVKLGLSPRGLEKVDPAMFKHMSPRLVNPPEAPVSEKHRGLNKLRLSRHTHVTQDFTGIPDAADYVSDTNTKFRIMDRFKPKSPPAAAVVDHNRLHTPCPPLDEVEAAESCRLIRRFENTHKLNAFSHSH